MTMALSAKDSPFCARAALRSAFPVSDSSSPFDPLWNNCEPDSQILRFDRLVKAPSRRYFSGDMSARL